MTDAKYVGITVTDKTEITLTMGQLNEVYVAKQKVKEFINKVAPKCNLDYIGDESKISITKKKFVEFVKELGL